jgi:hypothetical protein
MGGGEAGRTKRFSGLAFPNGDGVPKRRKTMIGDFSGANDTREEGHLVGVLTIDFRRHHDGGLYFASQLPSS